MLTLKKHTRIFTRRPTESSRTRDIFHAGKRVQLQSGAGRQDGCAALGGSSVNGAGIILIVVRENLLNRGRSLVVRFSRGGRVVVARCVDRAAGRQVPLPQRDSSKRFKARRGRSYCLFE